MRKFDLAEPATPNYLDFQARFRAVINVIGRYEASGNIYRLLHGRLPGASNVPNVDHLVVAARNSLPIYQDSNSPCLIDCRNDIDCLSFRSLSDSPGQLD